MTVTQEHMGGYEEASNHEKETIPLIDFESYRLLCDVIDDFRKVGIQDKDAFESAIRDERTIFTVYGGLRIPLMTPLEYEKMYNEERTLELSGKEHAMFLSIPLVHLRHMELSDLIPIDDDTIVIVEEFVPPDDTTQLDYHDMSDLPFLHAQSFDFKNPALAASPANETAWMAAYQFVVESKDSEPNPYIDETLAIEIMQKWRERCEETGKSEFPDENAKGTFLLSSDQLAERPDIIEQLWAISQIGFGKILGENHPVSMEFNRDFFDRQIVSENSITSVYYVDGEIENFSFLALDLNHNDWINSESKAIEGMIEDAKEVGQAVVHVHELIGRGKKGMGYAKKMLSEFFEVLSETDYAFSVLFESTNMSSMYIKPLVEKVIDQSPTMHMSSPIKTLGKLTYWGIIAEQNRDDYDLVIK